jgi:hypothetical protein
MMVTGIMGQAGQVVGVPGDPTMMYVISHTSGNVYVVKDFKAAGTLLKVSVGTNGNGPEMGLLGIAMHPKFRENKLMYVMYTASGGGAITTDEFQVAADGMTAMMKQNIHSHAGSNQYHNGGSIYFNPKDGPDKPYLYHSVGNAQSGGQSASPTGMNGKILRYDVTNKMGVPAMGATGMVLAHGLRNPYRMSIDRLTGDIWVGEVADAPGGAVYYWPNNATNTWSLKNFGYGGGGEIAGGISGMQGGQAALIGGVVYRGNKIKGICGRYFWGMHSNGAVRSMIVMNGQKVGGNVDHPTLSVPGAIASFGEDSEGEIWMSSKTGNAIYRIEAGP